MFARIQTAFTSGRISHILHYHLALLGLLYFVILIFCIYVFILSIQAVIVVVCEKLFSARPLDSNGKNILRCYNWKARINRIAKEAFTDIIMHNFPAL